METSWYAFTHPNRATLYLLYTSLCTGELNAIRKQKCFLCSPFYGRAYRWAMSCELKPRGTTSLSPGILKKIRLKGSVITSRRSDFNHILDRRSPQKRCAKLLARMRSVTRLQEQKWTKLRLELFLEFEPATRWSTTLSSKVNVHHAKNLVWCNLVT